MLHFCVSNNTDHKSFQPPKTDWRSKPRLAPLFVIQDFQRAVLAWFLWNDDTTHPFDVPVCNSSASSSSMSTILRQSEGYVSHSRNCEYVRGVRGSRIHHTNPCIRGLRLAGHDTTCVLLNLPGTSSACAIASTMRLPPPLLPRPASSSRPSPRASWDPLLRSASIASTMPLLPPPPPPSRSASAQ